jgi:addiction module HigA family antidote
MASVAPKQNGLRPVHPGELLRDVVLPELKAKKGMTAGAFAALVGFSRSRFYDLLDGKRAVDAETALKLGKLCGNGPELWLNMQQAWDLAHARQALGEALEQLPELNAA